MILDKKNIYSILILETIIITFLIIGSNIIIYTNIQKKEIDNGEYLGLRITGLIFLSFGGLITLGWMIYLSFLVHLGIDLLSILNHNKCIQIYYSVRIMLSFVILIGSCVLIIYTNHKYIETIILLNERTVGWSLLADSLIMFATVIVFGIIAKIKEIF